MKIIGHRGARGLSPENTIASIEKALEHGVDEIEIDVRMTKDNVAVVHHDPFITDPSGADVSIRHTRYAELLRHKPDLAALDMAIRVIAHRCPVLVEIKPGENPKKTIEIIRFYLAKGWRPKELIVTSKDQRILRTVHQALPTTPLVVIESWFGIRAQWRARQLDTKRISMRSWWLYRAYLKMAKKGGYQISPYTINSTKRAKKWQPYVYGIITDRPDLFEK